MACKQALLLAVWQPKDRRSFVISAVGSVAAPLLCKFCASTLSGNVADQRLQKLCNQWCGQCCRPPSNANVVPALCLAMWQPKGCRSFVISGVGSVAATLQCKCVPALCLAMWQPKGCRSFVISGVGSVAAPLLCKCCASTLSGNVAVQRLQKLCNQWCGQCCSPPPMQMLCQHFVWQCGSPKTAEAL